ncbi:MAG: glutamate formimidoyltransferase [Calditrichaeota bacterium]|nr:glutamate formimidoyltransferase [Calditrichota bacterium]
MQRIVECVPNFSEGRDRRIIDRISSAIASVPGVSLLDVDPGAATNRTVITFVGEPEAVLEAAYRGIEAASKLIDMTVHHGEHPRLGATDVCPFVPVSGVTMEECIALARSLGQRVGDRLGIPVYLYEYAASRPERRNLADIRAGEYEALASRGGDPFWTPDFGPDHFNPKSGATVIGARDFLIAYNVNLNTRDAKLATKIAQRIREMGFPQRDAEGRIVRDESGSKVMIPGLFEAVKAVGWYIAEYGQAQISINLVNYRVSPPHEVFDACCEIATELGLRVTGSELVGLIPLDALLMAGQHYLARQGRMTGVGEAELVRTAILSLGLSQLNPFDPQEKVIEYRIRKAGPLASLKLSDFIDLTASDAPAPGGGSVAALAGALAAALASMVAGLTYGRKAYLEHNATMDELATRAQALRDRLVALIDLDTEAFDRVMAAMGLPKKSDEQKAAREQAVAEATRGAASVPFETLSLMPEVAGLALTAAKLGNVNLTPDAGVAGLCAALAARGAAYNVRVNLANLAGGDYVEDLKRQTDDLLAQTDALAKEVGAVVEGRLWG